MILSRLGSKKMIAGPIWKEFPPHRMRIELFFGAGGLHFHAPRASYSVLNDIDDDVANLWWVVQHQREDLKEQMSLVPLSTSLVRRWVKTKEEDPVLKAVRFLALSNFTYLGKADTLKITADQARKTLLSRIDEAFKRLENCRITNCDFREVIGKISFSEKVLKRSESFIYLDPVYLGKTYNYNCPKWTEGDTYDCFEIMEKEGIRAAMSEFRHPFVLDEAERRGFNVLPVVNRVNLKNREDEILITNYDRHDLFSSSINPKQ